MQVASTGLRQRRRLAWLLVFKVTSSFVNAGPLSGAAIPSWRTGFIMGGGEERMAISALDELAGLVRLVHVLSPLPPAVAALKRAPGQSAEAHAESLSAVKGSTWEREKNWGLVEDRGQLVAFHALLPCTVALTFNLSGNATDVRGSARLASRACYAGAAGAIARATGARWTCRGCWTSGNIWHFRHSS